MDIRRTDIEQRKRLRHRRTWVIAAAAATVVVVVAFTIGVADPSVDRSALWVGEVTRGEMLREVRGSGVLRPREYSWLSAETGARVARLVLRPGAKVEPDTVIMELDNPELVDLHQSAVAALAVAEAESIARRTTLENQLLDQKASMAGIDADHEAARLQAQAERELADAGILSSLQAGRRELAMEQFALRSQIERDRMANLRRMRDAQLAADEARLAQLRSAAELRARQVAGLTVRAGLTGILQEMPVQAGQQVLPAANLALVARPDDLVAELLIPEAQVREVTVGQHAAIDTRNGIVDGTVSRIDPAVRDGTVVVEIAFDGPLPAGARPDMNIEGRIRLQTFDDVVSVARPVASQPHSEMSLFRIDGKNHATRVSVKFGSASFDRIQVTDGLAVRDKVVLSDVSRWSDHASLSLE